MEKIVNYTGEGLNKMFNVGQALKDGWGKDWKGEDALVGLKLQDRKDPSHETEISRVRWDLGIMIVHFKEGGWLCFDHAIENFKCIN